MTCSYAINVDFGFVYPAMWIGLGATAFFIGIVFMVARVFNNDRLEVWARDELPQLFLSAVFALFILLFLNIGVSIPVREISAITPFNVPPEKGNLCAYDFAERYLDDSMTYIHNTMRMTRIYLYMSDFISSIWKYTYPYCIDVENCTLWDWVCEKHEKVRCGICSLSTACVAYNMFPSGAKSGGVGEGEAEPGGFEKIFALLLFWNYCTGVSTGINFNPYSWVGMISSALSVQMHSSMVALLIILGQKYLLKSFVNGGFIALIPLGLILRSVPFMRRIGGILLGIAVGFIVIFPLLLVIEGLVFVPERFGYGNQQYLDQLVGSGENGLNIDEQNPYFTGIGDITWDVFLFGKFNYFFDEELKLCKSLPFSKEYCSIPVSQLLTYGAISFLLSSFLLSLNFIGTSAGIVGIGRFLGEEIEIARFLRLI